MSLNRLLNFFQGRTKKLPPGFRFQPTDEEIIYEYLIRKAFSNPLPASIIPEITNYKGDPWDIPGEEEQGQYFFTQKETQSRPRNRVNRTTKSGYWKVARSDKKIKCPRKSRENNGITGMRKTLVFHSGKSPNGCRTEWVMHEYRLVKLQDTFREKNQYQRFRISLQNILLQVGDWFLCHIFSKKRNGEDMAIDNASNDSKTYDLNAMDFNDFDYSSSSSCGSSSIPDVTSLKKMENRIRQWKCNFV